jgi:glycosyltransferase involved in cell wall biosynthesis
MVEKLPLVSVVVPVFNSEAYIADALESALNQSYPNKEVIVVDDGSTDSTPAILERFRGRITVIRQVNSGAAVARNTGIRRARGE